MATSAAPKAFKNFIDGEWVEPRCGKVIENRNPANTDRAGRHVPGVECRRRQRRGRLPPRTPTTAGASLPRPSAPKFSTAPPKFWSSARKTTPRDMTREMGKVLAETRGDVQEAIDMTYLMAGEGRRQFGQTTPSELPNKFAMSRAHAGGRGRADLPRGISRWPFRRGKRCRRWSPATRW